MGVSMLGDNKANAADGPQCVSSSWNVNEQKRRKRKTFLKNNPSKLIKNSVACESFGRLWNPHIGTCLTHSNRRKWHWFKHNFITTNLKDSWMAVPYHRNVIVSLDLTVFYEHYGRSSFVFFLLVIPNLWPKLTEKYTDRETETETEIVYKFSCL